MEEHIKGFPVKYTREFDKRYNIGSPPADLETQFNNLLNTNFRLGYYHRMIEERLLKMGEEKAIEYLIKQDFSKEDAEFYYKKISEKPFFTLEELDKEIDEVEQWEERSKDRVLEHLNNLFENIIKGGLNVISSSPPPKKD